jgi:3,4-dihydroxy 2-butanone 4-phosphate synthase/GTP cyclohydrolase II
LTDRFGSDNVSINVGVETMTTERIQQAIDAIRGGDFVVVVDAADRENEADLVLGAEFATTSKLAFLLRHTSGIVCAPMTAGRADALGLPLMVGENSDPHRTAFTVSVDACAGTGISAADRAATARALADPGAAPSDFRRPGHMFPLRAHPDGIRGRAGHTEASLELGRRAGIEPVMLISELMTEWGEPADRDAAEAFARRYGLAIVDTAEILALAHPPEPIRLPTDYGTFDTRLVQEPDGLEHLVLTLGKVDSGSPVLVRIHSECATGDLFGSRRCDCGEQLRQSLALIGAAGRGVIVYERGHEGRGIGLADKLRAYALQDLGADTIDANLKLGLPADAREFAPAARVLAELGVRSAILLTNNPAKVAAVREQGIDVEPCRLQTTPLPDNVRYLRTKQGRLGHDLDLPAAL